MSPAPTTTSPVPRLDTAPARSTRSFARRVALIGIVAVVVRAAYVVMVRHWTDIGFDAQWFHDVANGIADGVGVRSPGGGGATAHWPPGYPALLSLASLAGGRSVLAHRLVGALTGGVSVVGIGLVGRRVAGEQLGLRAAGIACFWPFLIATDGSLMAETLALPLVLGMILATYRCRSDPRPRSFALLGVIAAAAVYVRSDTVLVFVLLLTVALVWTRPRSALLVARAALAIAVFGVLLVPWSVRNTDAFDRTTFVATDLGGALEGANCPLTYRGALLGMWTLACVTHPHFGENESLADSRSLHEAVHYARRHVLRLPGVVGARVLRTWGLYPSRAQLRWESLETRWEPWQLAAWIVSLLGLPFAVVGLFDLWRARAPVAPLLAGVVAVVITSILVYGLQRFRVEAEPAVIVGIAAATFRFLPRGARSAATG